MCKCNDAYELSKDGKSCEKVHPCDQPTKGGCDQTCNKAGKMAVCSCEKNYKLQADKLTCVPGKKITPYCKF